MTEPRPFVHDPVLLDRVVELLRPVPAGWVIDATLGGAGHASTVLQACPHLRVLGLDRDRTALAAAQARLTEFGDRALAHHARFDQMATVVAEASAAIQPITGVLFDLGVSSPQFDDGERGFSYRYDAPIDMRMDRSSGQSAAEVLNEADPREIADILRRNADERFANRIAKAIVAARPVTTTAELAAIVVDAIPAPARRKGGHPAKRTFQALRIHVNGELDVLRPALDAAVDLLAPGGRLVAISYHSGEDRIVKERLRRGEDGGCTCPPNLPCVCGAVPDLRLLKRGGWTPTPEEIAANPRAASARLRAAEKLSTTTPEEQS